jgi:hypothetical protein
MVNLGFCKDFFAPNNVDSDALSNILFDSKFSLEEDRLSCICYCTLIDCLSRRFSYYLVEYRTGDSILAECE